MATLQAFASGTATSIGETIVGSHVMKVDGSSGTMDLGVGKSIKSDTFIVGGHSWYIECYPCGVDEDRAGWVSLFLCLTVHHNEQVEAECLFALMDDDGEDLYNGYEHTYNAEDSCGYGYDLVERAKLESLLKNDCFQIRCDVYIDKEFLAVPPLGLHRPISDLVTSGMHRDLTFQVGGEPFTVHRGLQGPSAHVAASPTSTAGASTAARISTENVAGSHVLTIQGYSNAKKALRPGKSLDSKYFNVGGCTWYLELHPSGKEDEDETECLAIFLVKYYGPAVKVRFELTLLTLAREAEFLSLQDSFHLKCDVTVVKEITPMRPPDLHRHFGDLLASQVGTDVTFDVGGDLFSAHKCVLATRSSAFMANFFGLAGKKGGSTSITCVQIDDMEPRVFKALLQFIYTDALPAVPGEDKVVMAQGLLVAADRFAMERLKLICSDMLCSYIDDARTAITTLDLADKHSCPRLREACKKFLMDHFAKDAP